MPHLTVNQHRLFYREQGQGPLLIILPNNTASSACYTSELEYFSQRFRCIALDPLGSGQSERIEGPWPLDWWRQNGLDAAELVRQLGQGSAIFMGAGGGGAAALWAAIDEPELVRAVVADSIIERFPLGFLEQALKDRQRRSPGQVRFWSQAHGEDWQAVVDADTDLVRRFSVVGGDYFSEQLRMIRCPVLLAAALRGSRLPMPGQEIVRMADQISQSRVYLTQGGNHPLMWSKADEFRAVADLFLTNLEPLAA